MNRRSAILASAALGLSFLAFPHGASAAAYVWGGSAWGSNSSYLASFRNNVVNDLYANGYAVPPYVDPENPYEARSFYDGWPEFFDAGNFGGGNFGQMTANRLCYDIAGDPYAYATNVGASDNANWDHSNNEVWGWNQWFLLHGGHHYFTYPFSTKAASDWAITSMTCYTSAPPNAQLSASPSSIYQGDGSVLSWNDPGGQDSCVANNFPATQTTYYEHYDCVGDYTYDYWSDSQVWNECAWMNDAGYQDAYTYTPTSGSVTVYPSQTTTYSYTCSNANGSVTAYATVYVQDRVTSCTSSPNSCGWVNYGQSVNGGACSASTPANPWYLGAGCSVTSAGNACGQTNTNYGTYDCNQSCSASTPAPPSNAGCNQPPNTPAFSYLYTNDTAAYVGATGNAYYAPGYRVYFNATDPNGDNVAIRYQLFNAQNGQTFSDDWSQNPVWNGSGGWTYTANFQNFSPGVYYVRAYAYDTSGATSAWSDWQRIDLNTPAVSGSCSANPTSIYEGQSVTWSVSGVSGGNGSYAYSWSGTDGLSGTGSSVSKTYSTSGPKTASVTISSAGLQTTVNCAADANPGDGTVNVMSCNPTLSANPSTIDLGQQTTFTWSVPSQCASSCQFSDGHSGGRSGTYTVTPPAPTSGTTDIYAVTCPANSSHTAQASVTVLIPTATISGNPSRVQADTTSTITWGGTDVSSCSITKNGAPWKSGLTADGAGNLTGSAPDTISAQSTYQMTCSGANGGSASAQAIVNVVPKFQEF